MRILFLAFAGWTALVLCSPDAWAFKRSRDPETRVCLYWEGRQATVHLNNACSLDVPKPSCEAAIWTTLDVWNQPTCSDFRFLSGGNTERVDVGFDQDNWDDNINLIIWQESAWNHERSAIGLTTTTYDRLTGEIVDTDVEFNGVAFTFTTADSPEPIVDIANTLTHEAGHMLGLDHSGDTDASMFSTAPEGEIKKRDLSQDDIDGLCHIYPTGRDIPPCEGAIEPPKDPGCDCSTPTGTRAALPLLLVIGLLLASRSGFGRRMRG